MWWFWRWYHRALVRHLSDKYLPSSEDWSRKVPRLCTKPANLPFLYFSNLAILKSNTMIIFFTFSVWKTAYNSSALMKIAKMVAT